MNFRNRNFILRCSLRCLSIIYFFLFCVLQYIYKCTPQLFKFGRKEIVFKISINYTNGFKMTGKFMYNKPITFNYKFPEFQSTYLKKMFCRKTVFSSYKRIKFVVDLKHSRCPEVVLVPNIRCIDSYPYKYLLSLQRFLSFVYERLRLGLRTFINCGYAFITKCCFVVDNHITS